MARLAPLAVISAVLLAGCPRPPIDFGPKGEIDDPEALLRLVAEAEDQVATLTGESKVRVDTAEAKGAFSMFMALSRPSFLHLEPLDFFGKPQAVLVVNQERFGLYVAEENKYYQGPASPQNVSRFLPIVLPAPELVQILLGLAPRLPHERAELTSQDACRCYVLTLHKGEVTQTLQVHPKTYRVLKSEVRGAKAYDLSFDDFADYGRVVFPRRVELTAEHASVHLRLQYQDTTLNQPPDLTLFDPTPPEGIEVVEVDQVGRPSEGAAPHWEPQLTPE